MKLTFAEHRVREEDKWGKIAEEWSLREWKRKRGRPPTRWRDELVKAFEITRSKIGRERRRWKKAYGSPCPSLGTFGGMKALAFGV